ncbi:MAG: DUF2799 domain-containing protein [Nevskiaceae bacterium]
MQVVHAEGFRVIRMLALLAVLGLAGCATMSAEQCRAGKWEETGRADGRHGERPEQLEKHRETCATHGIEPSADQWSRGYQQGVNEFCTPAGGYTAGRANLGDVSLCAGRRGEQEFLTAHRQGGQVYELLREVREMYRNLRISLAERYRVGGPGSVDTWELSNSEFVKTLKRRERWLRQRDGEYCDQYGVEPLTDADLDPDSVR